MVVAINMLGAGVYGECEFIFASIKVITITGLIVSCITSRQRALTVIRRSSVSFLTWAEAPTMTVLVSGTGRTPVRLSSFQESAGPKVSISLGSELPWYSVGAPGQFLGWWSVMTQAAFSFIGTEIVAIAAGEAKNPRRNLPKAIRRVYIRILLFYIGGTLIIGMCDVSDEVVC